MMTNATTKKLFKWGTGLTLMAVLFVLPLMMFTGCSTSPTQSSIDEPSFWDQPFTEPEQIALFGTVNSGSTANAGATASATQVVEPISATTGGVIAFQVNGYDATFSVPPAAIPSDTNIAVDPAVRRDRSGTMALFEFGPTGLTFSSSATLSVDEDVLGGHAGNEVNLYWLNPLNLRWVLQEQAHPDTNGVVSFRIDHFSMYGIGRK